MRFEDAIEGKIDSLSAGQKKVGRYLLAHIEESSYATLAKISRESGVSETTVIRFAYTLGFESFSTMQNALRAELLGESEREKAEEDEDNVYFGTLKREIEILEKTRKALSIEHIEAAAARLYGADRVFSTAGRTTHAAALWFYEILGKYREGVTAVQPEGGEIYTRLMEVTEKSVVVAISFARYTQSTIQFAKMAKERGAYIIAITDNSLCELALVADQVFITESNRGESGINTISSATALLNILAVAVYKRDIKKVSGRLKELEALYQKRQNVLIE